MKILSVSKFLLLGTVLFTANNAIEAQVSGNVNYQTQVKFPDNNININVSPSANLTITVKGLANLKADSYVAIFNVAQVGTSTEEVNRLIDQRIEEGLDKIESEEGVETYVDMISFVPVYEYEVEKKIFSKKSYNEIPAGFEVKKNIHVKYSDPELLNKIIAEFANAEIYDLVRVDYFSDELASSKKELMERAKALIQEKLENYEDILSYELDSMDKYLADGYKVVFPVEMYKSYQAYNNSSLHLKKKANINHASKSTTLYYQPIVEKEFDFVLNSVILEPVIQVMYEIKVLVVVNRTKPAKPVQKAEKEYLFITPNGDLKNLNIN